MRLSLSGRVPRVIEGALGPGLATLFLFYPGVLAAMWDLSFWGMLLTGAKKFRFEGFWPVLSLFAMAILFPVGVAATVVLWRLFLRGVEGLSSVQRRAAVAVLLLATGETFW